MAGNRAILLADECWVALALLHRSYPDRCSFCAREISDRLKLEKACPEVRPGVPSHLYQHNVANVEPSSARYRLFYRLSDGTYRLFRPGDDFHPARKGKTAPLREDLPEPYHYLLDWYREEYCGGAAAPAPTDPLLQLRGVGKEMWAALGGGDAFLAGERAGWEEKPLPAAPVDEHLPARVWERIVAHQGAEFETASGLPFTYVVEGDSGIWFYRGGRRIEQRLWRGDVEKAVRRCPLRKTTEIQDLRDYPYLFGVLADRRIRGDDW